MDEESEIFITFLRLYLRLLLSFSKSCTYMCVSRSHIYTVAFRSEHFDGQGTFFGLPFGVRIPERAVGDKRHEWMCATRVVLKSSRETGATAGYNSGLSF